MDISNSLKELVTAINKGSVDKQLIADFVTRSFDGTNTGITSLASLNANDNHTSEQKDAYFNTWKEKVEANDVDFFKGDAVTEQANDDTEDNDRVEDEVESEDDLVRANTSAPTPVDDGGDYTPPEEPVPAKVAPTPTGVPEENHAPCSEAEESLLQALHQIITGTVDTPDGTPPDEDFIRAIVKDELNNSLKDAVKSILKGLL